MKIVTIVGARPQFVKAAVLSRELINKNITEKIIHTGQHYDAAMSQVFFDELNIPPPAYNLALGGGGHGQMTGRMIEAIETILIEEEPTAVVVYGDTNSTFAGALAAAKLHIPVVHVEAGLRSFNRRMPEEINRVLTDHVSSLLFCPTENSKANLTSEGITKGVYVVGDLMRAALEYAQNFAINSSFQSIKHLEPTTPYILLTCHRAENTDHPERLLSILRGVANAPFPVYWPVHPRTRKLLKEYGLEGELSELTQLHAIEPMGYVEMANLLKRATLVMTDSGGLQKEAYWSGVPCLTLRTETEWVETVESGWNQLVAVEENAIEMALLNYQTPLTRDANIYGGNDVAVQIVEIMKKELVK